MVCECYSFYTARQVKCKLYMVFTNLSQRRDSVYCLNLAGRPHIQCTDTQSRAEDEIGLTSRKQKLKIRDIFREEL